MDAALPVVPMSALVASVAVQTVVALVVAAEARIVAALPVVVALAGNFAAVLAVDCRCTLCLPVWHFPSAI